MHIEAYAAILALARGESNIAATVLISPFDAGYTVISGTIPATVTVTHAADSYDVTVANNTAKGVGYMLIS